MINLESHKSQPQELKIMDFTEKDQCTWLIVTDCGLPTITVTDITKKIPDMFEVGFIEYELSGKDGLLSTYPNSWFKADPSMYEFPESQNVGSLQKLKFKDVKKTATVDGSHLYSALNSKRIAVKNYKEAQKAYNNLMVEYNSAVRELNA